MQPRDLELNEVVTNTSKMLRRILVESVSMELKFAPQPLFVHADAGMIDQIMMNLTVNARDAMPGAAGSSSKPPPWSLTSSPPRSLRWPAPVCSPA
jgi:nitrogen fixation/metabolism regulation signal transduction histidine kinase